ncbi:hypothetical protein CHS0354_025519 [Potamilus streckersoni]|uniref:Dehydrogenase/reductase SDR family member 11 n=1 Tax=Potamilus streckersoni TaxID=2493646 RepID=A0AAE0VXE7_9BIVA|nr:hypothetical protein CHS0354_025519 [Potamilus streckersoni]
MERWVGRVALVTGASAGIGEALVRKLAQLGMKVIGCARQIEKIEKLKNELKGIPGSVTAIQCDLSKEEEILAMFEKIRAEFGGVDVCVNNAGLAHPAPLLSGDTQMWRNMLDVNVLGLMICCREAYKSMQERKVDDGHIFLLNSMSGHRMINDGNTNFYSATKYAVTAITEGLRNELRDAKSHIRITAVSPGFVDTEFILRMYKDEKRAEEVRKIRKNLQPDDIADAVIYALQAPQHVQVHDILMRPTEQAF